MAIAMPVDWVVGWPDAIFRRIGHPVSWLGRIVSVLETRLNRGSATQRFFSGGFLALLLIACVSVLAAAIQFHLPNGPLGVILAGVIAWPLLATRSLLQHVERALEPLQRDDLEAARMAVGQIVGRDPAHLDDNGIRRAALESLAENASDGVVAPIFWGVIFGLPGIFAYKTINTLDSMIGYRNDRYEWFGKISARLDDVANIIPARLTATLFALATGRPGLLASLKADAGKHRSPNAGWPEVAMALAVDVRLSGPRIYDGVPTDDEWVNGGADDPDNTKCAAALNLYRKSMLMLYGFLLAGGLFEWIAQ